MRIIVSFVFCLLTLATSVQAATEPLFFFDFASTGATVTNKGSLGGKASLTGASTLKLGGPGDSGNCLDLSGNSATSNTLSYAAGGQQLGQRDQLTVTLWMRLQGVPLLYDRLVACQDKEFHGFSVHLGKQVSGEKILADFFSLEVQINHKNLLSRKIDYSDKWRFVAITYDGDRINFYTATEGEEVTSLGAGGIAEGPITATNAALLLGGTEAAPQDRTPPAWMADVRVFGEVLDKAAIETIRKRDLKK